MSEAEDTQSDLIVIGSSAGGIQALSILVSTLPLDFPAPIVLAQHLDPNRPSNLGYILQRRTELAVEVVEDRTKLEKGHIYVVPANRMVKIDDGYVYLLNDNTGRSHPSIDMLLSSAAASHGERLTAVILTGSGSDGAAGAVDVKNAGGTVIIQDPRTARYPSMPLSLPPSLVDFEASIDQIGSLLYDLLKGIVPAPREEKTEDILQQILQLINLQSNIDFRTYKPSTILRRINRRMMATRCETMKDYLEYVEEHPEEVGNLVQAFLINMTQFFRDAEAFAFLKTEILPKIVNLIRDKGRSLRFWTAGCATGEEPYSLAMLITDLLGEEISSWNIKIFATDADEKAISFARKGIYNESLMKGVSEEYRQRFFEYVDYGYRISKNLRQMVIFGQQDLSRNASFPHIDLVVCRNVLIYFSPELQDYVLSQFAFSLAPNGYLFIGKSETIRPGQVYYELVDKRWKIYRCTGTPLPLARSQKKSELEISNLENRNSQPERSNQRYIYENEGVQPTPEIVQLRRLNDMLLRFLTMGVVVIDRSYRVLMMNSSGRRLLGLREAGNEQDFLHMVRGVPYAHVRSAIDAVFREGHSVSLTEVELDVTSGGNGRFLNMALVSMRLENDAPDLCVISISDMTEHVQTRRLLEAAQVEQIQLTNELSTANKRLNDMNKELLDANEELQVANEELLLTQEELQATIEEFETTNEELQATNEELETNNEELQATNEELETTNEELRARTLELQEMTSMLENERTRLADMVELSPFYIMVLRGPKLIVDAFNPHYANLIDEQKVRGKPLEDVFEHFWGKDPRIVRLAQKVYMLGEPVITSRMPIQVVGQEGEMEERYVVYTIQPSYDRELTHEILGVIIYANDETEQQGRDVREELEKLRLIIDNTRIAALALYDAQTAQLLMGSSSYLQLVVETKEFPQESLLGRTWHELESIVPQAQAEEIWDNLLYKRTSQILPEVHIAAGPNHQQETIWEYRLVPIKDTLNSDVISFVLVAAVEITRQVQSRRELEDLNRLKDDFLSLAGHELRTPLTSIKGNAELLRVSLERSVSGPESLKQVKEHLELDLHKIDSIIHQTSQMNELIGELLDLSRIQGEVFELKKVEGVDIVQLARQVIEQYSLVTEQKVQLEASRESIIATVDEVRIEQVLSNLIGNGMKYSPEDQPIQVSLKVQRVGDGSRELVVGIQDRGEGISKEHQVHIFERYYRARTNNNTYVEGLGLGLYICKVIVSLHGGHIWLESKQGEGSTFYFSLPL